MRYRMWGLPLILVAGAIISLGPISAAAQNQTQTQAPAQTTIKPRLFDNVNAAFPCAATSRDRRTTKERLLALPANVVEPTKTPEGWPDLQGAWSALTYPASAGHSIEQGVDPIDIAIQCQPSEKLDTVRNNMLVDPLRGRIPYNPAAKAHQMELLSGTYAPGRRMDMDPQVRCTLLGVPSAMLQAGGMELRYVPGAVVFLSSKGTRIIPVDSPHVTPNVLLYMGDSRAHFEGHTLVIETINNREGTWFDKHGTFRSVKTRLTERITMVSPDTIYYEVTVDDPTLFTRTWKLSQTFDRQKNSSIYDPDRREDSCHTGENGAAIDRSVRSGLRARAAGIHGYHIHMNLTTGKAILPEDQNYLDETGQPVGYSFAPPIPDSMLPKDFNYTYTPPAAGANAKDSSSSH